MIEVKDFEIENNVLKRYTGDGGDIVIPDGIISIGDSAFKDCTRLNSITIPNGVIHVGERAFWGCESLTDITIPNSVTQIGDRAFWNCTSLTSITISESVTSIGDEIFYSCKNLNSVTIPDNITSIRKRMFWGCESLTSIKIPDNVTSIGSEAFLSCMSLTDITIPNSVTQIGDRAFWNCARLTSITIPESVTSIGDKIFYNCKRLFNIRILISPEKFFIVAKDDKVEKNIEKIGRILQARKMDVNIKISLNLKFPLAVTLVELCDNTEAKVYLKKMLTKGMRVLTDSDNLELIKVILEKTDFITKKNIDKYIQYAIDNQQQEIQQTLIHYKSTL